MKGKNQCPLEISINRDLALSPAFGVARGAPPLGAFPGGAAFPTLVGGPPLREMTSAAYGVSRDSLANSVAEHCQVSAFFAATAQLGGLPDEESRT